MNKTALLAYCAFDLKVTPEGGKLLLIPEGQFRGIDGRPYDAPYWQLTAENGRKIAAQLNLRSIDMLIDYEHGVIVAQKTGSPVIASGWLKAGRFEYVDGVGLCSNNWEWTAKAKGFIEAHEYKYLSPFFLHDEAGEVTGLLNVALTNIPNLDDAPAALLAAAAQDYFSQNKHSQQEDSFMNEFLKLMLKKLGLAENATEADAIAAANSQFASFDAGFGTTLAGDQAFAPAIQAAISVKAAANSQTPDPAKFVPIAVVTGLHQQIADLKTNLQANEVETMITAACSDGRLLGDDMKVWATQLGETNPQALKDYLDKAPKIPALSGKQTDNAAPNSQQPGQKQYTAEELQAANLMGVSLGEPK
ncbi:MULTISPECIES: phage protease [unclassified Acinetobacter]|uniref:phage protease n=1 Tax=unclassified Acinetobacter TaxID=196816 RepID=UPI00190D4508|nr:MULTISPECIES: phage protease [unclassified Acinetobacter]MBK0062391.1 hypothetical protein [Acinetobacter sp. S55]MBK0066195.1 hypothetical protein [Acinetobacter sp. S54]